MLVSDFRHIWKSILAPIGDGHWAWGFLNMYFCLAVIEQRIYQYASSKKLSCPFVITHCFIQIEYS